MMSTAVLCTAEPRADAAGPGGRLPYGITELERSVALDWVEVPRGSGTRERVAARVEGLVRRMSPGRRGWRIGARGRAAAREADVVLSVFEDAGLAFARGQQSSRTNGTPHVMVVCWMAEDVTALPETAVASLRKSMASVAAICVYSANQVPVLAHALRLPEERFHVVPFGVDTDYYNANRVDGPSGGGGVVAVGSDSRRDYATLFAAAAAADIEVTVACRPRNLRGLEIPPQVRLVSVFDDEYRALLHRADLVVTATTAPAYPSGQTVVLEAMSMGRATLTTDSPAMREYVTPDVDGLLVRPHDATVLADAMRRAREDRAALAGLATRAERAVRDRFTLAHQWSAVARVLEQVTR